MEDTARQTCEALHKAYALINLQDLCRLFFHQLHNLGTLTEGGGRFSKLRVWLL